MAAEGYRDLGEAAWAWVLGRVRVDDGPWLPEVVPGDDEPGEPGEDRDSRRALERPYVRPMDFTGRPMTGMVFVEPAGLAGTALQGWVRDAADYARGLPPTQASSGRPRQRP